MNKNSEVTKSEASDEVKHLVDLIINQDHVAQGWLKFQVTVQTGLMLALSYMLKDGNILTRYPFFIFIISSFGIIITIFLTSICIHERKWQSFYVSRYNQFKKTEQIFLFPQSNERGINDQKIGRLGWKIIYLNMFICLSWIVIIIFIR
jgi:hypothetical protein